MILRRTIPPTSGVKCIYFNLLIIYYMLSSCAVFENSRNWNVQFLWYGRIVKILLL